ncbi:MAG: hypothetical protein P8R42_13875 [Candidatus Binatia bacterium]|nr:hypothetical protein [Candidatus Binatia bacterium]
MHARRLDLGISLLVAVSWTMLLGAVPAAADEAPGGEIDLHVALDFRLDDGTDLLSVGVYVVS